MNILVIHGPNLNLLGNREAHLYGTNTLAEIDESLVETGRLHGASVRCVQSNHEGQLVDWIQEAMTQQVEGILINPAAFTHTSVAIRDALLASGIPSVEVHLSNPHARESFRHRSLIEDIVVARVMGFRKNSYQLGLQGLIDVINQRNI